MRRGSFLNHQWLIAARTPTWPNVVNDGSSDDLRSVVRRRRQGAKRSCYPPGPLPKTGPVAREVVTAVFS